MVRAPLLLSSRVFFLAPLLAGLLLSSCLLQKRPGAEEGIPTGSGVNVFTASVDAQGNPLTCAPSQLFKQFSPAFFSRCTGCHNTGGSGAGKALIVSGSDDASIMQNYITTMTSLIQTTEATSGDPLEERLLKYPLGSGHAAVYTASDASVADAANWMVAEWVNDLETPCTVIRPGVGLVE
jgi:hypothetical protein